MDHRKNCSDFQEMIFLFASEKRKGGPDDISYKDKWKELISHIESCDDCRAELSECEKLLSEIENDEKETPFGLHEDIMNRVSTEARIKRRRKTFRTLGSIAAVFVLVIGVYTALMGGLFNVANDLAEEDIFDFASKDECAPEAAQNNSGGGFYGDDGNKNSEIEKAESDITNGADPDIECEDIEVPGDISPVVPEAEDNLSDKVETSEETVLVGFDSVLEDFISQTEFSGGIGYYIGGDEKKTVFEKMTACSGSDPFSHDEYLILLFDYEKLADVEKELYTTADKYGVFVEYQLFGDGCSCIAIITEK